jgi:hypothetical protein
MDIKIPTLSVNLCSDDKLRRIEDDLAKERYTPWMVEQALRNAHPYNYRTWVDRVAGLGLFHLTRVMLDRMADCIFEDYVVDADMYWIGTGNAAAGSCNVELFEYVHARGERLTWYAFIHPLRTGNLEMLDALHKAGIAYDVERIQKWQRDEKLPAATLLWLKVHDYPVPECVPRK